MKEKNSWIKKKKKMSIKEIIKEDMSVQNKLQDACKSQLM